MYDIPVNLIIKRSAQVFGIVVLCALLCAFGETVQADITNVYLADVPAYNWQYGCFGTASGIMMGYWDRNGFDNIYTGPTAGGVAPLNNAGGNATIRALWASQANYDGRGTNYGHVNDYFDANSSEAPDPYVTGGWPEHSPDCIGDFMGLNQRRWTNMNDECNGNIDIYSFTYFATSGVRYVDFTPGPESGLPARDVQSGLRMYADYCGYASHSFSQLADVWQDTPAETGFTFEDLMDEIDAGYPVLLQLQEHAYKRASGYNPSLHAIVAVGYRITDAGTRQVRTRWGWSTSTSAYELDTWGSQMFYGASTWSYLRGVIGFRPVPLITTVSNTTNSITFAWDGPVSKLYDAISGSTATLHWYIVESAVDLETQPFVAVSDSTTERQLTVTNLTSDMNFFRVRHLELVKMPDDNLRVAVSAVISNKYDPTNVLFDIDMESILALSAASNSIVELTGMEYAMSLTNLDLSYNQITQLDAVVENFLWGGLGAGDLVNVSSNPLNDIAISNQIPVLTNNGVIVSW